MARISSHPFFVLLILVTAVSFFVMLWFNAMAADPAISHGLFKHGISNVSAKYEIELTPAGWTFSIWGVIYFFELAWIVYAVFNICRRYDDAPAYLSPCIMTPLFFGTFLVNHASNIVWLFLWDRELLVQSVGLLILTVATCVLGLSIVYLRLEVNLEELEDEGRQHEIVYIHTFLFNGIAMYGAWTCIATVLNLGSALTYKISPSLGQDQTAYICLGIIITLYAVFIVSDLTVVERFSRFTFSPYGVFLVALAGILSKNWNPEKTSSIAVAALAGLGVVGLILKLVVSFWRCRQQLRAYRKLRVWSTVGNEVYPNLSISYGKSVTEGAFLK